MGKMTVEEMTNKLNADIQAAIPSVIKYKGWAEDSLDHPSKDPVQR